MSLLKRASDKYRYNLDLGRIAKIWRAGCIIRARFLNDITNAYDRNPDLPNLLVDEEFRKAVHNRQGSWRSVIMCAIQLGVPMSAMGASLSYFDTYRSERLPANLIQAQRDFFGAHTFERIDKDGIFHADWET
jgi:6-phosphogluconate dehydrogenase